MILKVFLTCCMIIILGAWNSVILFLLSIHNILSDFHCAGFSSQLTPANWRPLNRPCLVLLRRSQELFHSRLGWATHQVASKFCSLLTLAKSPSMECSDPTMSSDYFQSANQSDPSWLRHFLLSSVDARLCGSCWAWRVRAVPFSAAGSSELQG